MAPPSSWFSPSVMTTTVRPTPSWGVKLRAADLSQLQLPYLCLEISEGRWTQKHLGRNIITRNRQLVNASPSKNNHTDLVILHLSTNCATSRFVAFCKRLLAVMSCASMELIYPTQSSLPLPLAFYRLQFEPTRTCQQYREQPDSRKNQPKTSHPDGIWNIRH